MKVSASSQIDYLRENLSKLASVHEPLWHPLGFVSCVIRDEPGRSVVRVHCWPKDERRPKRPDWPIHTHVYDLSSLVLAGRVRDLQYGTKSGDEYAIYSVSYEKDGSAISSTGRDTSLILQADHYHSTGEEYFVPAGSFHQTYVPQDESAITLVAQSNFQRTTPLVLGFYGSRAEPYNREGFDKTFFWKQVEQAVFSCKK